MPKIQIEVCIESENKNHYKTNAIIKDNTITYKEKDNTTVTFNTIDNSLLRKNNEIEMKYTFDKNKETIGKIKVLDLNKTVEIIIKTKDIIKEKDLIKIIYIVENNEFIYSIKILNKK